MKIKLLLFAQLKEKIGQSELDVNINGSNVAEALEEIKKYYPQLAPVIESGSIQIAVNEEYAQPDQTLQENDTLALIPPVSGG